MVIREEKIARFDIWCCQCKHEHDREDDVESPCWDCLAEPVNSYSHKPVYWKKKEKGD